MKGLENRSIRLRALEPEDLDILYTWENNPDIWHLSTILAPWSRHVLRQYLAQAAEDIYTQKQLRLLIETRDDERPLGAIDLHDFDAHHRRAGVGILIAEPADRRQGYAREALETLISYSFNILNLNQLHCLVKPDNEASLALFKGAGFKVSGEIKAWHFANGRFHDMLFLQCLQPL
ncbi:MAG: GNAT family N-acetyltransferase [Bacteroidetes bacterium]|nr:MAG: GNAT family N-acetyltransferase [Bacteroidota bacterium]